MCEIPMTVSERHTEPLRGFILPVTNSEYYRYDRPVLGYARKNRKTFGGKTRNREMIDVAAGEKRSG